MFPDDGATKGDLIEYYARIAEIMLRHAKDRPLALHRFPDGIAQDGFYQQERSVSGGTGSVRDRGALQSRRCPSCPT